MKVELTQQEIDDLCSALEHAQDDHQRYMESGQAEEDYFGLEEDLANYKEMFSRWDDLIDKLLQTA